MLLILVHVVMEYVHLVIDHYLINLINMNEFVIQISCGYAHNLLLTNKNNVFSFGWNASKQCVPHKNDNYILLPYYLDKQSTLKMNKQSHIQTIHCTSNGSIIIFDNLI